MGRWWAAYSGIWILYSPITNEKKQLELDPFWQNFLDPRIEYAFETALIRRLGYVLAMVAYIYSKYQYLM